MDIGLEIAVRDLLKSSLRKVLLEVLPHRSAETQDSLPKDDKNEPLLLRPRHAAKSLGISERTLFVTTRSGMIPGVRIGRLVRYSTQALQEWIRNAERVEAPGRTTRRKRQSAGQAIDDVSVKAKSRFRAHEQPRSRRNEMVSRLTPKDAAKPAKTQPPSTAAET